ncbi:MAG: acyltransferase 3 [Edaphobacter sp.]|nr:acyltransferase 3 [Edaphobacter sp.]
MTGAFIGYQISKVLGARYPNQSEYFQFFSFSVQFPIFLMGIVGYFVWKELIASANPETRKTISLMLLGVTGVLYWALLPFTNRTLYPTSLVCLMLVVALSLHPWPVLVNGITRFLGKISYSIYLLHFFIFINLQEYLYQLKIRGAEQLTLCFGGTLLLTIPLAYITWRWIEEPGIRLGRHVIAKFEARKLEGKDASFILSRLAATGDGN